MKFNPTESFGDFMCWLNCWADDRKHQDANVQLRTDDRWLAGYHRAVTDIHLAAEKLIPDADFRRAWAEGCRRADVAARQARRELEDAEKAAK